MIDVSVDVVVDVSVAVVLTVIVWTTETVEKIVCVDVMIMPMSLLKA